MRKNPEVELGVQDLIESFRKEGRLDSEGSFTIASRRAAGKLAAHQLVEEADWILKVVQSACKSQAEELTINQAAKATHITFTLPYVIDLKQFEACLNQGLASYQPGIGELCTALRSVGVRQRRAWVARLSTEKYTHWVSCEHQEIGIETTAAESFLSNHTTVLLGIAFPQGEAGRIGGLVRFGAAVQNEYIALRERAYACPIPLIVDGKRVDTLTPPNDLGNENQTLLLGLALGHTPNGEPISIPKGFCQKTDKFFRSNFPTYLDPENPTSSGSSLISLNFNYRIQKKGYSITCEARPVPSTVLLIHHGVIVKKQTFGIIDPIQAQIYICADKIPTDISGLRVNETATHFSDPLQELLGLELFTRKLLISLPKYQPKPNFIKLSTLLFAGVIMNIVWTPAGILMLGYTCNEATKEARRLKEALAKSTKYLADFAKKYCNYNSRYYL